LTALRFSVGLSCCTATCATLRTSPSPDRVTMCPKTRTKPGDSSVSNADGFICEHREKNHSTVRAHGTSASRNVGRWPPGNMCTRMYVTNMIIDSISKRKRTVYVRVRVPIRRSARETANGMETGMCTVAEWRIARVLSSNNRVRSSQSSEHRRHGAVGNTRGSYGGAAVTFGPV